VSLINELNRRNVFKVAIAYIVVAWLVMQVADVVLNNITAPGWVFQVLLLFLALGFPFAVIFAWAFEMTPEGIKREHEVDRSQSITRQTGRKLDFTIIGVLVVALGYFVWESRFSVEEVTPESPTTAEVSATDVAEPATKEISTYSIAVLPFVNMSSDEEQEYFSDGLSEELLNLLAKIPELKVASRSSAFQFKGEKIDLVEVAEKLKVAYVLEGSVRKAGKQIRITAQLIKADDGYHMWSETYDRSLENIFAIQDEISGAVVDALKIELLGDAPKAEIVNPEAYALMLKGRYLHAKWGKENFEHSIAAYKQALAIDPEYAEAWASLAVTYLSQTQSGYRDSKEGQARARDAVDRALALNPNLATAWARLALLQSVFEWDWEGAGDSIQKALELAPTDRRVLGAAANLASNLGNLDESIALREQILEADPLDIITLYNIGNTRFMQGRLEEAEAAFKHLLELNPEDWGTHTQLALIMLVQERPHEAWAELELEVDPQQQEIGRIHVLHALDRETEALRRLDIFIEENQSWGAYPIAGIYAMRGDADAAFSWLERAYEQHDGFMADIKNDQLLTSLHDDPRWFEILDKMGLPH